MELRFCAISFILFNVSYLQEMVRTQDEEIKRLSTIVKRHDAALNSDNRKCKPEVLESGQSSII